MNRAMTRTERDGYCKFMERAKKKPQSNLRKRLGVIYGGHLTA